MTSTLEISPEIKALVCEPCWRDVFTQERFKDLLASEGSSTKMTYTTTAESIAASSAAGCSWCTFLSQTGKNSSGNVKVILWIQPEEKPITPAGAKRLYVSINGVQTSTYNSYMLYTTLGDNASAIITPKDRVLNVGSDASFKMALERLDNCVQNHEFCPKPNDDNVFPDRVVDCSNPQNPKLVETKGQMRGAYATLSYVWGAGQKQEYCTKLTNLKDCVTKGYELHLFPKTIQDAITSTKKFGVRYLWVDSLCILQDSDDDKMEQMGKMNSIYRGAYVTIIAANAEKVPDGFLEDRPSRIPAARIPFICPDGKVGSVSLANTEWDNWDARHVYFDALEPVNGRGWCMQERFLSERAFIFASDTLRYYCQKETVSIGDALCEPSTGMALPRTIFLPDYKLNDEELVKARQAWQYVIWDYTNRGLGRGGEDKLNAVGGIAEQFGTVWKSRYLAGIWEHNLLEDILWQRSVASEPVKRSDKYRAPSWSWASIDGIVEGTSHTQSLKVGKPDVRHCDVVECNVTLRSSKAPFAAVTAGYLKLKAELHKVTTNVAEKGTTWPLFSGSEKVPDQIGWFEFDALNDIKESDDLFLAPIIWNGALSDVEALVLTRVDEKSFRRVGILSSTGKHSLDWIGTAKEQEITII